jgi:hypothetical protein
MTLAEIRSRIRNDLSDYPATDRLTAAINSTEEQIVVAIGKLFVPDCFIQIDDEIMQVYGGDENANTFAVTRGMRGTTPASHANSTVIMVNALFSDAEINEIIVEALGLIYPRIYRKVTIEDVTDGSRILEVDFGEDGDTAPDGIAQVWLKVTSGTSEEDIWAPNKFWSEYDGADGSKYIQFKNIPEAGTPVRIVFQSPWETLADDEDETTLDTKYISIISYYVCGRLGEKRLRARLRFEGHATDTDPSKSNAADILGGAGFDLFRWEKMLEAYRMPALPYYLSNQHVY